MHMASTIISSLSTLWIMGLHSEFAKAVNWIERNLQFNQSNHFVSLSQANAQILGGLISAYELSNNTVLLGKAQELGELMITAFRSTDLPAPFYNFYSKDVKYRKDLRYITKYGGIFGEEYLFLSEIGSFVLEFAALSYHTKNSIFENRARSVVNKVLSRYRSGLVASGIYSNEGDTGIYSVSGEAHGFYEYLLKDYLHGGSRDGNLKDKIEYFINEIIEKLLQQDVSGLYYLGILKHEEFIGRMDHRSCFFPGMLVLALSKLKFQNSERLIIIAKELTYTCYLIYEQSSCGLASESVYLQYGIKYPWFINNEYLLRPEAIESMMYLYHYTKDEIYRKWAWNIFLSIEKYTRNEVGYAGIENVNNENPIQSGCLPSYFFGATLKYLYLIFTDDHEFDLNDVVFNTEGHPLRIKFEGE